MSMTRTGTRHAVVIAVLLVFPLAGCDLLDVNDPTAIQDSELANADGANLLRMDARRQLYESLSENALWSGLLSDELLADTPPVYAQLGRVNGNELLDRRQSSASEGGAFLSVNYPRLQAARTAATLAMPGLRAYSGADRVGEMFAVRGAATLLLAEVYCPGLPLHEVVDGEPVYGGPLTTTELFEHALAEFDSAQAYAANSDSIANWARVGRARALIGIGRFADAAQAAEPVPVLFAQNAEYSTSGVFDPNELGRPLDEGSFSANVSVADREGGNGLDYVSADDPRVETSFGHLAHDSVTPLYTPDKYDMESDMPLATGIEARLIEAEAALRAGDITTWLMKLNAPRQEAWSMIVPAVVGPLPDLEDPGTDAERFALTFRERAFWLFGTAHRLGDLRRLVAHYGQDPESVFPTGSYRLGDVYEAATSIPFSADSEARHSPSVTGCTSR